MTTLADVLGPELAAADLGALDLAAQRLRRVGDLAGEVRSRLGSLSAGAWEGSGAAAFERAQHGPLPADLAKMDASFHQAGGALSRYRGTTGEILEQGRRVAADLSDAQREEQAAGAEVGRTQAALSAARKRATTAKGSGDPAATAAAHRQLDAAGRAAGGAHRRRDAARQRIAELQRRAANLREQHHAAVSAFIGAMHTATDAGISNSFVSGVERYVVNPIRDNAEIIKVVIEALGDMSAVLAIAGLACALIPGLQPLAAVALAVSAVIGGIAFALKALTLASQNSDPADRRSAKQRSDEERDLAFDAVLLLPFGRAIKGGIKASGKTKQVEKMRKHIHRDAYRPHPSEGTVEHKRGYLKRGDPKTYDKRSRQRDELERTRTDALGETPDLYRSVIEKGQGDDTRTAGVANADVRGRSNYRVEVRPCVVSGSY